MDLDADIIYDKLEKEIENSSIEQKKELRSQFNSMNDECNKMADECANLSSSQLRAVITACSIVIVLIKRIEKSARKYLKNKEEMINEDKKIRITQTTG